MQLLIELDSTIEQVNTKTNFIRHAMKHGVISYKVCVFFHILLSWPDDDPGLGSKLVAI
jgi:hypothetical protein